MVDWAQFVPTTLDVPLIEGITYPPEYQVLNDKNGGWPSINPLFRKKTSTPDLEKESRSWEGDEEPTKKCGFETVLSVKEKTSA